MINVNKYKFRKNYFYAKNLLLLIFLIIWKYNVGQVNPNDSISKVNLPEKTIQTPPEKIQNALSKVLTQVEQEESHEELELEIDGLVVNETRTKAGYNFYEYFSNNWESPPNVSNYSIVIKELPYRLRMTQIIVEVNDNVIFKQFLQPRYELVIKLAKMAMAQAEKFLVNYEMMIKQLEGEDQKGNGIY